MGLANDTYAQVGMTRLMGLLGKNSVLIVEFAVQKHHQGMSLLQAVLGGATLAFRPIVTMSANGNALKRDEEAVSGTEEVAHHV